MGAFTTLRLTRSTAQAMLLGAVIRASDNLLEFMVDAILRDRLYNCSIVADGEENDDDQL